MWVIHRKIHLFSFFCNDKLQIRVSVGSSFGIPLWGGRFLVCRPWTGCRCSWALCRHEEVFVHLCSAQGTGRDSRRALHCEKPSVKPEGLSQSCATCQSNCGSLFKAREGLLLYILCWWDELGLSSAQSWTNTNKCCWSWETKWKKSQLRQLLPSPGIKRIPPGTVTGSQKHLP